MLIRLLFLFLISSQFVESQQNKFSVEDLDHWDEVASELIDKAPKTDGLSSRLFVYLYNAQADTFKRSGNLNSISSQIFHLFFPDYKAEPLTDSVTEEIFQNYETRFKNEAAQIHPFPLRQTEDTWKGTMPYVGITIPTMMPWTISNIHDYISTPPPPPQSPIWKEQLAKMKQIMSNATPEQKKKVLFWDGTEGGWRILANKYMKEKQIPIEKQLEVRATLLKGIMDSMIAVFLSKYTYLVKRPIMLDDSIKTAIPTPNHPSYPAAHGSTSGASETILSHYFPEEQQRWKQMSDECGLSRIWAGIHFPIDISSGNELGKKVGTHVLNQEQ